MGDKEALRSAKKDRIDEFLRQQAKLYQGEERRWRANSIAENTREMLGEFKTLSAAITKFFPYTPPTERLSFQYEDKGLLVEALDTSLLPEGIDSASFYLTPSFTSITLGKDADTWVAREYRQFRTEYPTLPLRHTTLFFFTPGEKPKKLGYLPIAKTVSGIPLDTGYVTTFSRTTRKDILTLRGLLRDVALALLPE